MGPAKTRSDGQGRRSPRGLSPRPVEAGRRAARRRWPDAVIAQATCDVRHTWQSQTHAHTTHTHTHTHTRTHTHTHKYIHTHTHTPVARSCVLSLSRNLSISLSLGVPACVSGGGDALLAGADENSWQSRPRHACASSALTWAAPTTVQKHCPRKRHTLMAGSSAYAHGRHC